MFYVRNESATLVSLGPQPFQVGEAAQCLRDFPLDLGTEQKQFGVASASIGDNDMPLPKGSVAPPVDSVHLVISVNFAVELCKHNRVLDRFRRRTTANGGVIMAHVLVASNDGQSTAFAVGFHVESLLSDGGLVLRVLAPVRDAGIHGCPIVFALRRFILIPGMVASLCLSPVF